ncbi:arginine-binding extracellular protein ArtP precursor [Caedimonas varicaedens]|uniref:Arginine-binding extracellular protein ArtP n=1 Tax=Caedimonas varicaedens TaxID=1629334 RepID=A0A0K8MAJ5_9PROT|nr:arginine-binding extracellular protein ArtP precursor [Caedimonas varicaedens]
MSDLKYKTFSFLVGIFLCVALISCGDSERSSDKKITLTMVTSGDNPPFEFHDTSRGKDGLVGADIDIAHALANELGITLDIKDIDFNSIVPALQTHRADFSMALMTPSEERKKNIAFSDIYYTSRIAVVTLQAKTLESENSLEGKKIGVQLGSTNEQAAKQLANKIKSLQIILLNKLGELIQEVRVGRIDGLLVEEVPAKAYTEANKDLDYRILQEYQSSFAIAFPKDSPWIEKFNVALKKLKARGKLEEITRKWLK